jgi:hypothetical protein
LIASLTSFGEKVGQLTIAPLLGNLVKIAESVSAAFDKALDPEKGNKFIQGIFKTVGAFVSGPGLVLITTAFLKITMLVAKFAKEGFQAVLSIGSAQEKQAQIQGGIVGLLQRDAQLRKVLNSATATQAQKEQAVIQAIQRENQLLQQQQSLLQNIVGLAARRGVAGYSSSGGFTGKGGKRFAAGFQAEEATAMMLGANSGVKAQYGKGTIGGRRFIMNNQEMEITNFGRNGDSAVIPKYAKGFVPNFAKTKKKVQELQPNQLPTIIAPTGRSGPVSYAPKNYPYSFKFRAVTSSDGEMDNLAAYFAKNYDTKKVSDLLKQRAKKDVKKLSKELDISPEKPSSIGEIKNPKGFEGSVGAVMGSVFDSALSAMFASKQYDGDGGDFDVRKPSPEALKKMQILFGENVLNKSGAKVGKADFSLLGDYKSDAFSKHTKESMFKKVKNELAWMELDKAQQNRKIRSKRTRMSRKGRAEGYIPNFNSMNKGIPVSQIRAHFDPIGNPVAVTNTRDEPNGLKDAIGRERQGIGMAASGFVPNFAVTDIFKRGKTRLKENEEQRKAIADNIKSLRQLTKSNKNSAVYQDAIAANLKEAKKLKTKRSALRAGMNTGQDSAGKAFAMQAALAAASGVVSQFADSKKQELEVLKSSIEEKKREIESSKMSEEEKAAALEQLKEANEQAVSELTGSTRKMQEASSNISLFTSSMGSAAMIAMTFGKSLGPWSIVIGAAVVTVKEFIDAWKAWRNKEKAEADNIKLIRKIEAMEKTLARAGANEVSDLYDGKGIENVANLRKRLGSDETEIGKKISSVFEAAYSNMQKTAGTGASGEQTARKEFIDLSEAIFKNEKELQSLQNSFKEASEKIRKEYEGRAKPIQAAKDSAIQAKERIDFMSGITQPENTPAFVGRAISGQQSFAEANVQKTNVMDLQSQLGMAEVEGNKELAASLREKLAEASSEFNKSVIKAGQDLYNNVTLASQELDKTRERLRNEQTETFDSRLNFADSLKGQTITPETLAANVEALRSAEKGSPEQLEAAQRLAQNQADLNAINPALFAGMLKSMGLTPEEQVKLTEDLDRSALEQSGITDKAMQDAIIAQLEAERPDLTKTQGEITALESALKDAQEQVNEFKTAFKEGKSIMAAAESFSSQLKGLSDGTVTASQVLETINSANGEALTKIAEATKKMSDSMVIVDNQNKIIAGVVAEQKKIAQRLGIQITDE